MDCYRNWPPLACRCGGHDGLARRTAETWKSKGRHAAPSELAACYDIAATSAAVS